MIPGIQTAYLVVLFIAVALSVMALADIWQTRRVAAHAETAQIPSMSTTRSRLLRDLRLSERPRMDAWLRQFRWAAHVQLLIAQSGIRVMTDQFMLLMLLIVLVTAASLMALGVTWWMAGLASLGVGLLPVVIAMHLKHRRRALLDQQLPDFLDAVARAMQAGNAFSGALSVVSKEAPEPIGAEFRRVFEEINFGRSVKEGLESLALRVESDDVRYFVIAVLIHQQTGGSLTSLLLSLSTLIRDRQRLRKLGRVLSAEGRMSAWILGILPFATGLAMYIVNPEFVSVLWTNPVGIVLVQGVLLLMTIGLVWMWRIVHFRI